MKILLQESFSLFFSRKKLNVITDCVKWYMVWVALCAAEELSALQIYNLVIMEINEDRYSKIYCCLKKYSKNVSSSWEMRSHNVKKKIKRGGGNWAILRNSCHKVWFFLITSDWATMNIGQGDAALDYLITFSCTAGN